MKYLMSDTLTHISSAFFTVAKGNLGPGSALSYLPHLSSGLSTCYTIGQEPVIDTGLFTYNVI